MKKQFKIVLTLLCILSMLAGCGQKNETLDSAQANDISVESMKATYVYKDIPTENVTEISLSDEEIKVNGEIASTEEAAVYVANDIVYYEEGHDFTYGEGEKEDEHSKEEADAHQVVHITKAGTYQLSGSLSAGQIAIDLGKDAKEDSTAVVNLILNGVDIKCSVAPAVIFYNVYECGDKDTEDATNEVDTEDAGANVWIADNTVNNINGSYVARIYESVELNEDGTEVVDSKKLHKYDAAFYSKKSMNIYGGQENTGVLNITAENEGLDSELHLTINGGNIYIRSGNDGINTNEDGVSVTTMNGGLLDIVVTGETGEGDGIDSNGWLVINGGIVKSQAYGKSMDSGIDSDMGIHLNGGIVIATGNMLDEIAESEQKHLIFQVRSEQDKAETYTLKNEKEEAIAEFTIENEFSMLIVSFDEFTEETYTLWCGDENLGNGSTENTMFGGGMRPGGMGRPNDEMPEGMEPPNGEFPEGMEPPNGEFPDGMEFPNGEFPEGMTPPEGMEKPERGKNFK